MLRIPLTAKRTNESVLQDLKLKQHRLVVTVVYQQTLKFFDHIMRSVGIVKLTVRGVNRLVGVKSNNQ